VRVLNQQPKAIYDTLFPLQQLNSSCYITPNIIYKENLGDAMAPACPKEIRHCVLQLGSGGVYIT